MSAVSAVILEILFERFPAVATNQLLCSVMTKYRLWWLGLARGDTERPDVCHGCGSVLTMTITTMTSAVTHNFHPRVLTGAEASQGLGVAVTVCHVGSCGVVSDNHLSFGIFVGGLDHSLQFGSSLVCVGE